MNIISKVLSTRIKVVLPYLNSSNQTAFVKNRFISKNGRAISDILEIAKALQLESFLDIIDIEKAFDSVNHCFLFQILRKFGWDFVSWIKTILKNQESWIINGGKTRYFKLERSAWQEDPISSYLFLLVSEIFLHLSKNNPKVKGLKIFKHEFLYTAYVDDTTFFLKDRSSIIELMNELNILLYKYKYLINI